MTKDEYKKLRQDRDIYTVCYLDYMSLDKKNISSEEYFWILQQFFLMCQVERVDAASIIWQGMDLKYGDNK